MGTPVQLEPFARRLSKGLRQRSQVTTQSQIISRHFLQCQFNCCPVRFTMWERLGFLGLFFLFLFTSFCGQIKPQYICKICNINFCQGYKQKFLASTIRVPNVQRNLLKVFENSIFYERHSEVVFASSHLPCLPSACPSI